MVSLLDNDRRRSPNTIAPPYIVDSLSLYMLAAASLCDPRDELRRFQTIGADC